MADPRTSAGSYPRCARCRCTTLRRWVARRSRQRSFGSDLLAGLTVAAVALPLNVGLAIASGMPPSAGLVAGAIGGLVAGIFGSSRLQVSGPAAALSVMVLALAKDFGVTGVAAATVYIGLFELALAFALAGRVIKYVPESVLAGFTNRRRSEAPSISSSPSCSAFPRSSTGARRARRAASISSR